MKTRLLPFVLLCLICIGLSAQNGFGNWVKHRKSNRNEQAIEKTVTSRKVENASVLYPRASERMEAGSNTAEKYYPPQVNREFTYYDSSGNPSGKNLEYFELDHWGNILLKEQRDSYRTTYTYSEKSQGKLQLSETHFSWRDNSWIQTDERENFTTQVNGDGIRVGVTGKLVQEATFNEKGYLSYLREAYQGSSDGDRAKVWVDWKGDFPSELKVTSYTDSVVFKNVVFMYDKDKFNPYLCFSDDWEDFLFDGEGSDLVFFNADIVMVTTKDDDGNLLTNPTTVEGRMESVYDSNTKMYTRTLYATFQGMEYPTISESKIYLDDNGSFTYTYLSLGEGWTYSVTKMFNEYGDVVTCEERDVEGDYSDISVETYNRTYDASGHPLRVGYERRDNGDLRETYIETYGDRIVPDTSLEVTVETSGTLRDKVTELVIDYYNLTELIVNGPLNEDDFQFINYLSSLQRLDLSLAKVDYLLHQFSGLNSLVSVSLPEGLKYVSPYAFSFCPNLKSVELPSSLTMIESGLFRGCNSLKSVVCRMLAPAAINSYDDPFEGVDRNSCILQVPMLSLESYTNHPYWGRFGRIEGYEGLKDDKATVNGPLHLNETWFNRFTELTLGYGAGLTINGEAAFPLKKLTMYQGDNQIQEFILQNSYGNIEMLGRQVTPSSLVNHCESVTVEEVKIEYMFQSGRWYFLSFPFDVNVADITIEKLDATNVGDIEYVFRYYDGATRAISGVGQNWKNVSETVLKAGQGYIFQVSCEVRLGVKASSAGAAQMLTPAMRKMVVSENVSEVTSNQGWNFIGNPYPSYFNMQGMDYKAPITVWNNMSQTYEAYSALDADEYILSPMQAFFVQVPSGTKEIQFTPDARLAEATVVEKSNTTRMAGMGRSLINLRLSDGTHTDKTRVVITPQASLGYEIQEDAAKFMSPVAIIPQLYTLDATHSQYAINVAPLGNKDAVKVGYYAGMAGEYVLSADRSDVDVWLWDALTGTTVELSAQNYHFTSEQGSFNNRFTLYMSVVPTSVNNESATTSEVLSTADGIIVKGQAGQKIEVYTVAGAKIAHCQMDDTTICISLAKGAYLVKVGDCIHKSIVY